MFKNNFIFDCKIYTQVEGAAIGLPVSPIFANLYLEWFEEHVLQSFPYHIMIGEMYMDKINLWHYVTP